MDYKDSPIYILYNKSYIILQYIKIYVYNPTIHKEYIYGIQKSHILLTTTL